MAFSPNQPAMAVWYRPTQDMYYWSFEPYKMLTAWIALEDATRGERLHDGDCSKPQVGLTRA